MKKRNVLFSLFGVSLLASVLLAGCSGLANPLKKAKVTFDPSRVSCTLAQGGNSEIKSGAMVAENTALYFKAALPADKTYNQVKFFIFFLINSYNNKNLVSLDRFLL